MKKIIVLIFVLVLGALAIKFLKEKREAVEAAAMPLPLSYTVKTVMPEVKTIHKERSFLAQIQAQKSTEIASKLTGFITNIHVKEAQHVKKGELLVSVDDRELQSAINVLESNIDTLKSDAEQTKHLYERNLKLHRAGGLALEKLDASEVLYKAKKAALLSTQENIKAKILQRDYLSLKAPYEGEIATVHLDEGDMALPGKAIVSLHSKKKKLLLRYVDSKEFVLQSGQKLFYEGKEIATLASLYSEADHGLNVAEAVVDVDLEQPDGAYINVNIVSDEISGCTVPLSALIHREDAVSVMQYVANRFEALHVIVEAQNSKDAIIKPCPTSELAVAAESKLILLPTLPQVSIRK